MQHCNKDKTISENFLIVALKNAVKFNVEYFSRYKEAIDKILAESLQKVEVLNPENSGTHLQKVKSRLKKTRQ